ncbi:MAG: TRZ/ATZ family hydrolase [Gammaproteobacteria bacterium]|nr:TRZ/ATZ family hydrolase [Gammaproteobacteria bacterium]
MKRTLDTPIEADLLIHAKWAIPVVPLNTTLENVSIAIKAGEIIAIFHSGLPNINEICAKETVNCGNSILLPGFVNAHGHAAMSLFRGIADDMPLQSWLNNKIWPLEAKHANREFVEDGTLLAIAEMIKSGTTCFADMYFFPDAVAESANKAKIRAQLASPIMDFATIWAENADEYIAKTTELYDTYRFNDLISIAFGPHAPYSISDQPLIKLAALAEELDVPIHMHLHETADEIKDSYDKNGCRPIKRLADLGILSHRFVGIHATQLDDADISTIATTGVNIVHCPESNMKLASGFCRVHELKNNFINVALGTDGCASNNDLDMISEMRTATLIAKVIANDASAVPAHHAIEMATLNGAKALGLDHLIGSIESGKHADLVAISMDDINQLPMYRPESNIVYSTQANQVSHVWCRGVPLLREGKLTTINTTLLKERVLKWQKTLGESIKNN